MNSIKSKKERSFLFIALINSFTEKEMNDLSMLVDCHYFNTDRYVSRLFYWLEDKVWNKRSFDENMQYEVFAKIFDDRPPKVNTLNKEEKSLLNAKMTLLTRLAETFLILKAIDKKPACKTELLHDELLERKQFLLFNRHVNKRRKELDKQVAQDIDYHHHQYHIEHSVLNYLYQSGQITTKNNLAELNHHLDIDYILNKLSFYLTEISLAGASNRQYSNNTQIKSVIKLAKSPIYVEHPLVQIYLAIIQMMEDRALSSYEKMLSLLKHFTTNISSEDRTNFYTIATVFCSREIMQGNLIYNRKAFELYQLMHEEDILKEQGSNGISNLKNLVTVCCRVGEFDWATQIIEEYRSYIESVFRDSVCHFNLGAIAFYQSNYQEAIRHFIRVDKVNLTYDLNCRVMLLKSHYETDKEYDERTMQIFRSAEKFIHENKSLAPNYKKGYKNFIRLLINVYRIRHRATKITKERVLEKLEQVEFISDKHWLAEKIKEL